VTAVPNDVGTGEINHIASSHETQRETSVSAAIVSLMNPLLRWATTKEDDMMDNDASNAGRRKQRLAGAVGLLLAGGLAGGVLAATNSASAADTTNATAAGQTAAVPAAGGPAVRGDTATPVRAGEKALTGTDLATAKAAALKAVPGGTVFRVETDADGAVFEAHMTKANGAHVTVKLDKDLKVTEIQDGMGTGGPSGSRGHAGADQGTGTDSSAPAA
jgi:hypothetical protein